MRPDGAIDLADSEDGILAALAGVADERALAGDFALQIGGQFSTLGDRLGELLTLDRAVGEAATRLDAVVGDRGALEHAHRLLERSTMLLEANLARADEIDARLTAVAAGLASARRCEPSFGEATTYFWMLTTAFRIEATSLSSEHRDLITPLIGAMETIHRELKGAVAKQFSHLGEVEVVVVAIGTRLAEVRVANRARAAASREHVQRILEAFQGTLDRASSFRSGAEAAEQNESLRQSFSGIVVALQFQDIVSQKLEQVARAFDTLATPIDGTREQQLAVTHFLACVQDGQIASAGEKIFDARLAILRNVTGLLLSSDLGLHSVRGLRDLAVDGRGGTDAADLLLTNLSELHGVVASTLRIAEDVGRVVEEVRAKVVAQIATMASFATALHLVAINAQIHSAKVPAGTALEMLSDRTRGNSADMRALTSRLLVEVRAIVPELEAVDATLTDLRGLSAREQASLQQEAIVAQRGLRDVFAQLKASFSSFEHEFIALRDKVRTMLGEADYTDDLDLAFARARRSCSVLAAATKHYAEVRRGDPVVGAAIESLRVDYVMQGQRDVHDLVTRAATSVDAGAEASAAVGERSFALPSRHELVDLGDNIELF
jgi:hypothetical protein